MSWRMKKTFRVRRFILIRVPHLFHPVPKQAMVFTCLKYKSFENTVGKGEIARNENV